MAIPPSSILLPPQLETVTIALNGQGGILGVYRHRADALKNTNYVVEVFVQEASGIEDRPCLCGCGDHTANMDGVCDTCRMLNPSAALPEARPAPPTTEPT